ncbi:ATP-binding protein [Nakamurella multipartita]|uniref:histidine kinase n=1 Tax=Nakamurella multipartita (strain ATCC 700099 / DSM 44233 / CIP 104796 / JCM 9543 / NBRC 105858 / Y-104) TaxID=479431 RepID=C8XI29_NAKMY|nr:ATP-binding protein [Nakamurella multipartita]ACV78398.1 multi-sensor signal transduction histidine kinase [Nakamurella multipartita DSM 44233]
MHKLLAPGVDAQRGDTDGVEPDGVTVDGDTDGGDTDGAVLVVRAGDVAAVRRSSPDSAIVALVRSTEPAAAIAAQLAGADLVLPWTDETPPREADLAAARVAARLLAGRARGVRRQTREAAHEVAGQAGALTLLAELLGPDQPPTRAEQLRRLAARGAQLAWQAGRVARTAGAVVERVDVAAVVHALARTGPAELDLHVDAPAPVVALVDQARLIRSLEQLIDNARRAGARQLTLRVSGRPGPAGVRVLVVDDGPGLPAGWTSQTATTPFVSGWAEPADGLGLAEVADFAADHGGTLRVTPRPDAAGVRVELRLPAAADTGPHPGEVVPPPADADGALAGILEGIARRAPLAESLEDLVATMERHLPDSRCSILVLDQDTRTLHHGAGARLPAAYRAAIDGLSIGPQAGSCGTAAFTRQEVVVADIATDRRWADYRAQALPHGLRSCWSRPILAVEQGVVLGTFAVYHAEPWVPDESAIELVQRLTHVAAVAIGTAALYGQLVESEARFRSTFEAAGLGIALVGPSGTIQDANAALTAMAGRDVVGQRLVELLDPRDAAGTADALAALLRQPETEQRLAPAEVRVRRAGEPEPLWAALSGSLIRGSQSEPRHFCIELFDLTERRRVAQARRAQAVAQAADRAKSELLALVSHEVRTPLNAVIGFAQVLRGLPLTPERQSAAVEHILGAGRHLLQLINDLIDLTGAETRQLQLTFEPLPAGPVVAEAMQIVAGMAEERSIALSSRAVGAGPAVWADRHRLRQVLLNLLGNAIKFTPAGGRVEVIVGDGEILVRDTGEGIAPDQVPLLFTPFHRAGTSSAEGSGLGLALSQRLMRAMGGELTLLSTGAGGSTFMVVLPAAAPAAVSDRPRSPVPAS